MYCPKCGKEINDSTKFCPQCGYLVKKESEEKTKEIDIKEIKEIEESPKIKKKEVKTKKLNSSIYLILIIIILILIIILLVLNNVKKKQINIEPKQTFCSLSPNEKICKSKETVKLTKFDSLDFTNYDFSNAVSKEEFYNNVIGILNDKQSSGIQYCNQVSYTNASNNINAKLNLSYSYLCGMDLTYLNNLITRLEAFYKQNNINDTIVDSYVVGRGGRNEYANYTGETIGSNSSYIVYLRRIHMNSSMFDDYDKLTKSYERDLEAGFHPKNSVSEDIVVHETAHAIDFYITASRKKVDRLIIDDFNKYNELFSSWSEQLYSKEVVLKAVERVNNNLTKNNLPTKTELELRKEISEYAATTKNGTIMYAETFAEALVDYFSNGVNASQLSVEIYKIVQEDLNAL